MKNIRSFSENFHFFVIKFSVYSIRLVFVMALKTRLLSWLVCIYICLYNQEVLVLDGWLVNVCCHSLRCVVVVLLFFFFFFFLLNAHRYVYRSLDIGNVLIVDISSHFFAYTV